MGIKSGTSGLNATHFSLTFLLLVLPLGAAQAQEQSAADTVQAAALVADAANLGKKLESVGLLIEKSSAARRIEGSAVPAALARREEARELHHQAGLAGRAGNSIEAVRLLNAATQALFDAAHLATSPQMGADKKKHDFEKRLSGVKALLQAQQRLIHEKNADPKTVELAASIERATREAEQLYAANKLDEARTALDKGYAQLKGSVEKMREGDTLVRSLNFATPADEYRYEIDRNEAHLMLIKTLQDEGKGTDSMVQKFLTSAAGLRKQAEVAAGKGDYESGIKLLEDSTQELVRAIRNLGIYVPG